jgi:hypothetical protein
MDLVTLSTIVESIYVKYPKLKDQIEIASRGSKTLYVNLRPRCDTQIQDENNGDIYFNVIDYSEAQFVELIENYRIYRNFGLSDFQFETCGV